jgi:hypothetical protein
MKHDRQEHERIEKSLAKPRRRKRRIYYTDVVPQLEQPVYYV